MNNALQMFCKMALPIEGSLPTLRTVSLLRQPTMNRLLTLLFFCSGATALVYEVVWSKYLALMFGSTVQAQTVVLAVFMGGLALGNRLFGNRADLMARPVGVYGIIEMGIGIYALLFPFLFAFADGVFIRLGANLLESSGKLLILKGVLSVSLLIIPTVLMGGTLPLVAAWLQKRSTDAGKGSAGFYAVNTFGAVAGAGLAGFYLVRQFGMPTTLQIAGVINLLIGIIAIVLAKREVLNAQETSPLSVQNESATGKPVLNNRTVLCLLVFFTGAVSLGLEVLASRSLSMIFGASLQAFSVMLMAFILGVGGGGLWVAWLRKQTFKESTIAIPLLIAAGLIAVFLLTIEYWAVLYIKIRHSSGATDKYLYHQVISTVISLVVIGIPAGLIGSVLPLCMRILSKESAGFGAQVGKLLTCNTLGAVCGALVTGFILMPALGLRMAIGLMGMLLALAALGIAFRSKQSKLITVSSAAAGVLLLVSVMGGESWQFTLSSGIFRTTPDEITDGYFSKLRERDQLLYYRDGTDATVAVVTDRQPRPTSERVLSINGKPDGSVIGDLSTEYLLAHLPMMSRPHSKDVFVLGFGTGITAGALTAHPVESITVAENCAPVLEAAKHFEPWNRGVLTNKLTGLYREDARTVLKLSERQYDIIISEPSNPWTSGIGSVFSREFYQLASSRLRDGGIMAQWFHIYEMSDDVVELVLRTFNSVFPVMEIWETRNGDLILLGGKQPWKSSPQTFSEAFERPGVKKDMDAIDLSSPAAVFARQVCSQNTAFAVAGEGLVQTDAHPVLEYEAPKAFYRGIAAYRLFHWDERTSQAALASQEKREALSKLTDKELLEIFGFYGSANVPLIEYVAWRNSARGSRQHAIYTEKPFMDIIFRLPETFPAEPQIPGNTPGIIAHFLKAEALLYQTSTRMEGATQLEQLLQSLNQQESNQPHASLKIGSYAAKAARAHYMNGDPQRALACVELGLKKEPSDPQLQFLKRLFQTN